MKIIKGIFARVGFFLMFFLGNVKAQTLAPKTIRLINDSSGLVKKKDTLAFIPPYIFTARTKNYDKIDSTNYLYFEDSMELSDNIRNKDIEEYYRNCCYFWFRYRFDPPPKYINDSDITIPKATKYTKHSKAYVPIISDEDYNSIYLNLKKIEKVFNDSIVISSLKLSDELFQILSKYSSSLCVLTDIKEYGYVGKIKLVKRKMAVCLYRVIVIDMRIRHVFYYNSIISSKLYGPEYARGGKPTTKYEKSDLEHYTGLQPIRYILGGLLKVRKKKE